MDDEITPAGALAGFWRWFWVGVLGLGLLAILIAGGWQAGWWFAGQNASRQAHLIRNGYSNQQTLREQITTQIANVNAFAVQIDQAQGDQQEIADLESQRISVVNIACQDASEITGDPLPGQQAAWVDANCSAGSIRPGSKYGNTTGGN